MKAILNQSPFQQMAAMFKSHGPELVKIQVTRAEMASIVSSGEPDFDLYFPKIKEERELFRRRIAADRTVLRARVETGTQAYFDAVDEIDIRERDFKQAVPKRIIAVYDQREIEIVVNMNS